MTLEKNFNINTYPGISRFKEKAVYDQQLHALTIFPYNNTYRSTDFFKLILNFSLKDVGFNKKKAREVKKLAKSGYDCAKWLVDYCIDHDLQIPDLNIQSANPVGKENINGLLNNAKKHLTKK
jgi:hypothetical protein